MRGVGIRIVVVLAGIGLSNIARSACPPPGDYALYEPVLWQTIPGVDLSPKTCGPGGDGVNKSVCASTKVYLPNPALPAEYVKNQLFVFLPGTGNSPDQHDLILKTAAYAGYIAIGLSYANVDEVTDVCRSPRENANCVSNPANYADECLYQVRKQRISGEPTPFDRDIRFEDTILGRLLWTLGFLIHYDNQGTVGIDAPGEDFDLDRFCYEVNWPWDGNRPPTDMQDYWSMVNVSWPDLVLGGFSQGSGHTALIALENEVGGFALVDGPNDMCCPGGACLTEDDLVQSTYYSAIPNESAASPKFAAVHATKSPPLPPYDDLGFTLSVQDWDATVDASTAPTLSAQIVTTNQDSCTVPGEFHNSMAVDSSIPTTHAASPSCAASPSENPDLMHLWEAYLDGVCL